jgi:type III restriction enzyme
MNIRTDSDPLSTWEAVLTELETLLLAGSDQQVTSEHTPNLTRLGIPEADQKKMQRKFTTDGWLDLALTAIEDEPIFLYRTKEKEFIDFDQASAGQQATALLRVLLAQTGMPLIIDQPEEDLDSQVIEAVVTQLWKAKRGRQIIFTSHNANLVVNGDAELVIVCDYRTAGDHSGGRIRLEGAIDMPEIRDAITHVMEGGEKAFKLRQDKYGF